MQQNDKVVESVDTDRICVRYTWFYLSYTLLVLQIEWHYSV